MKNTIQPAQQFPQPFDFSESERRDPKRPNLTGIDRREPHPERGSRQPDLESVRYLTTTLQDILDAIQTDWPPDRPQSQKLQERLGFGEFALTRVRNGALRRMAESAP